MFMQFLLVMLRHYAKIKFMKWFTGIMITLLLTTVSPLASYRCQKLDWRGSDHFQQIDPCLDGEQPLHFTNASWQTLTLSLLTRKVGVVNAGIFGNSNPFSQANLTPKQILLPLPTPPPK
jgi:hypothetical protein